ncbi:MAG TPA: biotin--[acetyl-CoA-carboxylase] ligase, partial [Cupriavidus sp.]|nr:biotin--[acetyl-CoA-carboxylase] ligase [Cupriavidus sp.]
MSEAPDRSPSAPDWRIDADSLHRELGAGAAHAWAVEV